MIRVSGVFQHDFFYVRCDRNTSTINHINKNRDRLSQCCAASSGGYNHTGGGAARMCDHLWTVVAMRLLAHRKCGTIDTSDMSGAPVACRRTQ